MSENIDVVVVPVHIPPGEEDTQNEKEADALEPKIARELKKALEKAAPLGDKAKREAQEKVGEDAARQLSPNKFDKIKIRVDGKETRHWPKEGAPPPPETEPKP